MIRDLIERWLIWWELDRPAHRHTLRRGGSRNGSRSGDAHCTPTDRVQSGRLPRLFSSLHELDQRLTDEAPTARHAPSPELRRRTLEALRQSALTGAIATPRRWSTAVASLTLCTVIIAVAISVPQRTAPQSPPPVARTARLLLPDLSASLEPDLDFVVAPLITEARLIVDDLGKSAHRFRSIFPPVRSEPSQDQPASPTPELESQS